MSKVETGAHVRSVRVHARASLGAPCWGLHTKSKKAGSRRRPRQSRRQQRRPHTPPSCQIRCCGPAGRLASDSLESKKCDDFAPKFSPAAGVPSRYFSISLLSFSSSPHRTPIYILFSLALSFSVFLSVCLEVTVTSLHPPRLCRIAVFSIKPTFLSQAQVHRCTGARFPTSITSLSRSLPLMRGNRHHPHQ